MTGSTWCKVRSRRCSTDRYLRGCSPHTTVVGPPPKDDIVSFKTLSKSITLCLSKGMARAYDSVRLMPLSLPLTMSFLSSFGLGIVEVESVSGSDRQKLICRIDLAPGEDTVVKVKFLSLPAAITGRGSMRGLLAAALAAVVAPTGIVPDTLRLSISTCSILPWRANPVGGGRGVIGDWHTGAPSPCSCCRYCGQMSSHVGWSPSLGHCPGSGDSSCGTHSSGLLSCFLLLTLLPSRHPASTSRDASRRPRCDLRER